MPMQTIDKRQILISNYMAVAIIGMLLLAGWKGNSYYRDLQDSQKSMEVRIMSKLRDMKHDYSLDSVRQIVRLQNQSGIDQGQNDEIRRIKASIR